jgi:hypothetical protein
MDTGPVNRGRVFLALEIAFVAFLGWVVSTSLISGPGSNVQADTPNSTVGNQKLQQSDKTAERWVPQEGPTPGVVAEVGTPNACQGFDFAGGAIQGFTVEPVFGTPLVLWHVTNGLCRASLVGHSTPYTFYYGQDLTCNYDTGARNAANLISPPVSLAGVFPPYVIGFNYLLFVEGGGFDTTFVDLSTNNGATWTQILSKANLINDNQWHNASANVTTVVGAATSIRLRFRFDTIDNIANATTGWHVDDILVCGEPFNFCLQSDSGDNILQFNSITGKYLFRQCSTGFTREGIGIVTANGCNVSLQDNGGDRIISANVDTCAHTGSALLTYRVSPLRLQAFNISDSNTLNNTCACP